MKHLTFILQIVTKLLLIFFLFFIWVRYFIKSFWLSVLISIIITAFAEISFVFFSKKKKLKSNLKLEEKEKSENIFLSLCQEKDPAMFFKKLIAKKYKNVTKTKNYISFSEEEKNKTVLYIDTVLSPLSLDRLNDILKNVKNSTKIIICTGDISKECFSFIKNFDIEILLLNKFDTYQKLYKEFDCYPEITIKYKKDKKLVFYDFIAFSFNKARTKGYLLTALILLFSSFFVRANLYYCITSSILVIFAIISFFNPVFNKKVSSKIL